MGNRTCPLSYSFSFNGLRIVNLRAMHFIHFLIYSKFERMPGLVLLSALAGGQIHLTLTWKLLSVDILSMRPLFLGIICQPNCQCSKRLNWAQPGSHLHGYSLHRVPVSDSLLTTSQISQKLKV